MAADHVRSSYDQRYALTSDITTWVKKYVTSYSALSMSLPLNAHLLTFKSRNASNTEILFRINHLFEDNEDSVYSQPVTLDLSTLFQPMKLLSADEMTLTMNLRMLLAKDNTVAFSNMTRWSWNHDMRPMKHSSKLRDTSLTVKAMEIASLLINLH